MVIGFDGEVRTAYPHLNLAPARSRSFVVGLHDTHSLVESPGERSCVQVALTPLGAHLLFGLPMRELRNRVVDLSDLFGTGADLLVERLAETPTWEGRFALLDQALLRRLDVARPASPDVAWAWSRLIETGGRLRVAALCEQLGCSRKHLVRRFDEQVGLAPKTYARVLRFEHAIRALDHRDGCRWGPPPPEGAGMGAAELALACGYYDQAHMVRDFRQFAGVSPSRLAEALAPAHASLAAA